MEKSNFPLVTIVTATYKNFNNLFDTISSVLQQDYPRIEYIICDDGSEDFPEDRIRKYISQYSLEAFFIVRHSENVGTVKNLNSAYKKSNGEYIINLSRGDVFFEKNTVGKIVDVFRRKKASVVVSTRLLYHDDYSPICFLPHYDEQKLIPERYNTPIKQYKALILGQFYDMASGSAMHYSRDIIEKIGYFDEKYSLWEDGPFLIKYLWNNKLEFAYDIISIWYQDGGMSRGDIHPKLVKDELYYNSIERVQHKDSLSFFEKRKLQYLIKTNSIQKSDSNYNVKKIITCLYYLPECLYYRIISKKRAASMSCDKDIIKSIEYDLYFK